ncbi:acyl carrier protein [Eubacterium sp. AF15-50]|nr:acyl carrier protein [Eubacterium sp. AF16-48]RHR76493.1 acyl carrier protein [Eubacterium sp. AF15-50]
MGGKDMRDDIIEILCDINPLWDPDDEDMSIAEFLESKQLMELIVALEDKFDVDIPYDERNEDNFENIDTIIELLEKLQ